MGAVGSVRWTVQTVGALVALMFVWGCDDSGGGDTPVEDAEVIDEGVGGQGGGPGLDFGFDEDMAPPDTGPVCDCPGNQICDDEGACLEHPDGCSEDVDCEGRRICDGGMCAAGCADDMECADPAFPICVDGRCGDCRGDEDCFGGVACVDSRCAYDGTCVDSRQCPAGQVCDGGACAAEFDCGEAGCPGSWACGDDGQCRPHPGGEQCQEDAQCAIGQVCGATPPAFCGPCAADEDCPGAQVCERSPAGARCAESAACADNADCLGNRVCDGGSCVQPQCDDDVYAGNDTPETAAALEAGRIHRDLVSCGPEYFTFDLPANTVATISLRQLDREGDLSLAAFASNGVELNRSATNGVVEAMVVGPFGSDRPVVIEVSQVDAPVVVAFELNIALTARGAGCVDDGFEVAGGDDTEASARYVRGPGDDAFAPVAGRACPGDADWICFDLKVQERVTIQATVNGGGVLIGEIFRDGESQDAEGRWTSDPEEAEDIQNFQGARGTYCLRLAVEGDPVTYALDLQAVSPNVLRVCQGARPVRIDGDGRGAESGELPREADHMSPSCSVGRADGGEAAWSVSVAAPSLLVARVQGSARGTLGDPVLSVRGSCPSANTEIACASGWYDPAAPGLVTPNPAEIRVPVDPGDYTVLVDGVDAGDRADYGLEVELQRLSPRPPNDACESARPLVLDNRGEARVSVNLDQARDDVRGCLGAGAPDAAYTLSLDTPARVRVDAAAANDAFAVGAYIVGRCGDVAPVACGFGFDAVVPAGEWFVVVDGSSANARGRVEMNVHVEAFGEDFANDTCAGAEAVRMGTPVIADTRGAADDYGLVAGNRCTGFDSRGGDLAYVADLEAGRRYFVEAAPEGGWDLSLYVVRDCGRLDPTCVDGSDGALTETVVFTAEDDGDHFIIVDGSNGEGGAFTLRVGEAECARDADCEAGEACSADFTCE